jgi:hypothetical protein
MGHPGVAAFFIAVIVVAILAFCGWIVFVHLRARRLGLPTPTFSSYNPFASRSSASYPPQPAPSGVVGWVSSKIRAFKNRNRSGGGAYEEPLNNVRGRQSNRGFGPLDPDDAWDAHVGTEADVYGPHGIYEEQELGLHQDTSYGGGGAPPDYDSERGRPRSRGTPDSFIGGSKSGLDTRYDEETGRGGSQRPSANPFDDAGTGSSKGLSTNPFGDTAESSNISLRGVSPRPLDTSLPPNTKSHSRQDSDDSPTERRSMFREDIR